MNEENQRIFIAEARGWKTKSDSPNWTYYRPDGRGWNGCLPDYLKDLNAMHEVVSSRVEAEGFPFQEKYTHELRAVVTRRRRGCNKIQIDFWMAEATAAQRAEAFLRAIGKWVE